MTSREVILGTFLIKDTALIEFILKEDGLVYTRGAVSGEEEGPGVTVKQFWDGMDRLNKMLDDWRKEAE